MRVGSELWQRLRAARKYADKRQQDIAESCRVSRGAVAQWESEDPNNRTRPDVDQLKIVARETGVPVEWFLNDAADVADVWKVGVVFGGPAKTPPRHNGSGYAPRGVAVAQGSRALETFVRAVEFALMEEAPELVEGFNAYIGHGPSPFHVDYYHGKNLVQFGLASEAATRPATIAHLLLLERAAGRAMNKHLVIWERKDDGKVEPDTYRQIQQYCLATFGVHIPTVASPAEAATYLTQLG